MQKVNSFGMPFDSKKNLSELNFNLPKNTEILSAFLKKDNKDPLWISYIYSLENFFLTEWQKHHFLIVKCCDTDVEINSHKYVGTITVDNDAYAIFHKKVTTEK